MPVLEIRWMEFSGEKVFTFYLTLCLDLALPAYYQEGVKVGKGRGQRGEGKGRR